MNTLALIALFLVISPVSAVAGQEVVAEVVVSEAVAPEVVAPVSVASESVAPEVAAAEIVAPDAPVEPRPPVVVIADGAPPADAMEPTPGVILVVVREQPAAPAAPATVEVTAPEPLELEPEPAPFTPGAFSIGLSGLVGTHAASNGGVAPTWTSGIDLGLRLTSLLTIGVRRITASATRDGAEWGFGGSPYVELAWRFAERFEPYVQLGAAVQGRTGLASSVGVAPFTGGGMRFYLASCFSLAVEGAAHVPVTENVLLGHELFPFGSVVLQGGLAFTFHIG